MLSEKMPVTVLTYGTFDLFHVGHLRLLQRAKKLGDQLVVGVSTDAFNAVKGKRTVIGFNDRMEIVRSIGCVSEVFPEAGWEQKSADIERFQASILVMGSDWTGKFDHLRDRCEVIYLPRTQGVSSTSLRSILARRNLAEMKLIVETISAAIESFGQDDSVERGIHPAVCPDRDQILVPVR
jgi:glycerol-3-phosphate cytidylyltransferase